MEGFNAHALVFDQNCIRRRAINICTRTRHFGNNAYLGVSALPRVGQVQIARRNTKPITAQEG